MAAKRKQPAARLSRSPVTRVKTREINWQTRILIFVRSGGRCQFPGCNKYLLEHPLTRSAGNFAEFAHIVAFSEEGPRGRQRTRPKFINDIQNLMLLCATDHKEVDDHPAQYPRTVLEGYRTEHEKRIKHVTSMGPELSTKVVQLKANIRGNAVAIPDEQVFEAVNPKYPDGDERVIDLTPIHATGKAFLATARQTIDNELRGLLSPRMNRPAPTDLSIFALGPIPVLVYLGSKLSNTVDVGLHQYHRDTKRWTWKQRGPAVKYAVRLLQRGTIQKRVALLLSLSGTIDRMLLPKKIDRSFFIYELRLAARVPGTDFLRTKKDLAGFRAKYLRFLGTLQRDHGQLDAVHLFPAIPAPIAVACGHDPLKVHPSLLVYDLDHAARSFTYQLRIN